MTFSYSGPCAGDSTDYYSQIVFKGTREKVGPYTHEIYQGDVRTLMHVLRDSDDTIITIEGSSMEPSVELSGRVQLALEHRAVEPPEHPDGWYDKATEIFNAARSETLTP